ncbi:MAG: LytTR family DNA-binding domain-containing protein [Eubacteriales bacterium]|nr:LytTR family DNA-binding domain-containing protein [Eubacteriales bacterium]
MSKKVRSLKALAVAVCEDQKEDQEKLRTILSNMCVPVQTDFFDSGEALLAAFAPRIYDLLLMDIYMHGLNGIETVSRIRAIDQHIPVAFITSSTDFALESYRLSAMNYIEKPYSAANIERVLQTVVMMKKQAPALSIRKNHKTIEIPLSDIQYLEQQLRQVHIVLADGQDELIYGKLSDMLPKLDARYFCCTHKSYCVNLDYVHALQPDLRCFIMKDGANIPIRRSSYRQVKQQYEQHLYAMVRKPIQENRNSQ